MYRRGQLLHRNQASTEVIRRLSRLGILDLSPAIHHDLHPLLAVSSVLQTQPGT